MDETTNAKAKGDGDSGQAADSAHDEQGVDLTLIDEMLRLEPIERLRLNDRAVNAILELRRAFGTKQ